MKKYILGVLSLFVVLSLISGCTKGPNQAPNVTFQGAVITTGNTSTVVKADVTNVSTKDVKNVDTKTDTKTTTKDTKVVDSKTDVKPSVDTSKVAYTITAVEGDLIKLNVKAVDPDGGKIAYTYSKPFNDNGLWQTKDGDEGKYLVKVTASDGISNTTADVLIVIKPSNKAPVVDCPEELYIKEGQTVSLECTFYDKENDPLVIEYDGWMNSASYTTNYDSSGDHKVFVKASDGFSNTTKTVIVHVENVDRSPIFNVHLKDLTFIETDVVTIKPNITDPDNDAIKLTYSDPFDKNGVWKTKIGDAGTYPISIVASDGQLTTKETFTITVKMLNTAPVMKLIPNLSIYEGDVVKFAPEVSDREKDPIQVSYSGWMSSNSYTTSFDDAYPKGCNASGCSAVYKVTVTASDGEFDVHQDVYITVMDKNRAPEFVWPTN